jgi:hypothetical protein
MKIKMTYYKTIVSVFEKYGFVVIPTINLKTILIMSIDGKRVCMTRTDVALIVDYEGLSEYVTDIEPSAAVGYVISVL